MQRVHLRIRGFVQGVSFRYYARQRAQALGLAGWARNCPDGSVEIEAQGPEDAVRQFVAWARRGPSMAQVEGVELREEAPDLELRGFEIRG